MLARMIEFATNHYLLGGVFLILLVVLIVTELRRGGRSINSRELTALVNSEEGIILDVRPHKDFAAGHIVGALNIPYEKVVARIAELDKYKEKSIIVVDAMGQHAGSVGRDLNKAGFNAVRLAGGVSGWRSDNLPVVK